jgi:sulfopyruvate decarboxylase TPP-binding subunit
MVMMNAGFLLAANALATVCIHPGIPVLMLIGHSGGGGE